MNGWDGIERRAAVLADHQSKPNGKSPVEAPTALILIGFVAVILLQAAGMYSHILIERDMEEESKRSARVDESLTCYLVKFTQGGTGLQLLSDCGFLPQLPNPGGRP